MISGEVHEVKQMFEFEVLMRRIDRNLTRRRLRQFEKRYLRDSIFKGRNQGILNLLSSNPF
jgi:hypothetical protein